MRGGGREGLQQSDTLLTLATREPQQVAHRAESQESSLSRDLRIMRWMNSALSMRHAQARAHTQDDAKGKSMTGINNDFLKTKTPLHKKNKRESNMEIKL